MKHLIIIILYMFISPLFAQWHNIFLFSAGGFYNASSELEKPDNPMDIGRYSPANLLDHDSTTAWVEGEIYSGEGTYAFLGMGSSLKNNIIFYNGYQQSDNLFKKNNRIKDLKLTYYIGFYNGGKEGLFGVELTAAAYQHTALITLQDKTGPQVIDFPFDRKKIGEFNRNELKKYLKNIAPEYNPEEVYFMKFEIISVYEGSTWDDTCIAEIDFSNREMGEFVPLNESIIDIYKDNDSGNILMKTSADRVLILADAQNIAMEKGYFGEGEFLSLNILDVSSDNKWTVITEQHGFTGGGHIEETYQLWSLKQMRPVPESILKTYGITAADAILFISKNNRIYLETADDKTVRLDDLELDMASIYK